MPDRSKKRWPDVDERPEWFKQILRNWAMLDAQHATSEALDARAVLRRRHRDDLPRRMGQDVFDFGEAA
jgi:hypothetical protein